MLRDLEEYILRLDNLINNLDKLYKTISPEGVIVRVERSHIILIKLNSLLEQHELLHACFFSGEAPKF